MTRQVNITFSKIIAPVAAILLLAGCGSGDSTSADGDQPQEGVLADQEGTINDAMAIDSAAGAEADMIMDAPAGSPVTETEKKSNKPAEVAEEAVSDTAPATAGNATAE